MVELNDPQRRFGTNHDEIVRHAREEGFVRGLRLAALLACRRNAGALAAEIQGFAGDTLANVLANKSSGEIREYLDLASKPTPDTAPKATPERAFLVLSEAVLRPMTPLELMDAQGFTVEFSSPDCKGHTKPFRVIDGGKGY